MYFVATFLLIITIVFVRKWRVTGDIEMLYLAIGFFLGGIGSIIVTFMVFSAINMTS